MALEAVRKLAPANKEDYSGIFDFIDEQEGRGSKPKDEKPARQKEEKPKEESLNYYGARIVVCKGCDRKFY